MRIRLLRESSNRISLVILLGVLILAFGCVAELSRLPRNVEQAEPLLLLLFRAIPGGLLNSLPAFLAMGFILLWLAPQFIRSLYDARNLGEAYSFLERNVFGMTALRPLIIVKEGRIATVIEESNEPGAKPRVFVGGGGFCDRVGGRALLILYNDSAVVLERGGRLTRVVGGPSFSFLEPFERIWEVLDLRPQRWLFDVSAMTKDGIPVTCQADITFKIDDRYVDADGNVQTRPPNDVKVELPTDKEIEKALGKGGIGNPLPYDPDALFRAATSIWVRIRQPNHKEQLRKWTGRVMLGEVEGALRNIIARYRLDWLMQDPQAGQKSPRESIREELEQKLQESLKVGNPIGARIVSVDLGKIDIEYEAVSAQWIQAWQAEWERRTVETIAEGEAEMARLDSAHVQAEAEMALMLLEAIRPLVRDEGQVSSYLLALRFAETMRWMAYDPFRRNLLPSTALHTIEELEKLIRKSNPGAQTTQEPGEHEVEQITITRRKQ